MKKQEENSNYEFYNKEIMSIENSYLTAPSKIYFDLIEHHMTSIIPFSDDELYFELFKLSSNIMNNSDLESWGIIEKYAILKIDNIDISFLVEIIEQLSESHINIRKELQRSSQTHNLLFYCRMLHRLNHCCCHWRHGACSNIGSSNSKRSCATSPRANCRWAN